MGATPVPYVQLRVLCYTNSSGFENILWYLPASPVISGAQMIAVCEAAYSTFETLYRNVMYNTGGISGVAGIYNNGTNEYVGNSTSPSNAGNLGNGVMPDEVAVCLRKNTSLVGRANRGRWFVGGCDTSVIDTGNPNEVGSGIIAAYKTLVAALVADQTWDGITFHARHWNRKVNALEVITSGSVSTRLATARARRRHSPDYAA